MFATFLYAAIFCFVCCLRYQPSCTATVVTNTANLQADTPQPSDINHALIHEPEWSVSLSNLQNADSANALIATGTNSQLPVTQHILDASEDSQPTSLSTDHGGSDFGVTRSADAHGGSLRQAQGGDAVVERSTERSRRSLVETQSNAELTVEVSQHIVIEPSKLTLRQCRAVIREINKGLAKQDRIRQKINGKDAPADWLRSQIARYLEAHPDKVIAVEELLKVG